MRISDWSSDVCSSDLSWLAGQRPCSAFPVPGGTSDPGAGLAAHSCGYSDGIEPASLFTVPCGSGTFTRGGRCATSHDLSTGHGSSRGAASRLTPGWSETSHAKDQHHDGRHSSHLSQVRNSVD